MPDGALVPTISEARQLMLRGQLHPVELLDRCIENLERSEAELKAWLHLSLDAARKHAASCDVSAGPLSGIPMGIKDIFDVAGMPTTAASKVLPTTPVSSDAPAVATLRAAGAIFMGKTNTHEFAYGYVTPPTCNPWDPSRIPGGSSGGSAAAVAAGHCLGATGSDTGGSIRVPAALCGLTGLKPRPGLVSLNGVIPLVPGMDTAGPIALDADDCALLWSVMSGTQMPEESQSWTLGIAAESSLPELEPGVASVYAEAIRILSHEASATSEATVPKFEEFDRPRGMVVMPAVLKVHVEQGWWPAHSHLYTEETRTTLSFAEELSPATIDQGVHAAEQLVARLMEVVRDFDVIATPATSCTAPTHEEAAVIEDGGGRRPITRKLARLAAPVNMAGLAAISVPCGLTPNGLPVGLQLIGKNEELLLQVARQYQEKTGWHRIRPKI